MSRLLTTAEVAERLGITRRAVTERASKRTIPFIRLGKLIKVYDTDLDLFVSQLDRCDVGEAIQRQRAAKP